MPKISVVMAVYNRKEYVARSIKSILNQTYKDFEFILVDDGSTDNSSDIMKQYAKNDRRIKYIRQNNSGLAHARNTGSNYSQGKYIAFMDDDDISVPERLEKQLKFMENNPEIDACAAMQEFITPDEKNIGYQSVIGDLLPRDITVLRYAFPLPFTLGPSTMIKKEKFDACLGFRVSPNIIEDMDFTLRFQEKFSAAIVGEYLYRYTMPDTRFGDNLTTRHPTHFIKSYIVSYLCAWFRRNTDSDPVEENKSLDEIIQLIPQLPYITRNSIFNSWVPGLCNNIIRTIKKGEYISDEELTSLITIIKYIAPEEFASNFTQQLTKHSAKKLIKQGKLIEAFNAMRI